MATKSKSVGKRTVTKSSGSRPRNTIQSGDGKNHHHPGSISYQGEGQKIRGREPRAKK